MREAVLYNLRMIRWQRKSKSARYEIRTKCNLLPKWNGFFLRVERPRDTRQIWVGAKEKRGVILQNVEGGEE